MLRSELPASLTTPIEQSPPKTLRSGPQVTDMRSNYVGPESKGGESSSDDSDDDESSDDGAPGQATNLFVKKVQVRSDRDRRASGAYTSKASSVPHQMAAVLATRAVRAAVESCVTPRRAEGKAEGKD